MNSCNLPPCRPRHPCCVLLLQLPDRRDRGVSVCILATPRSLRRISETESPTGHLRSFINVAPRTPLAKAASLLFFLHAYSAVPAGGGRALCFAEALLALGGVLRLSTADPRQDRSRRLGTPSRALGIDLCHASTWALC